MAFCTSATTPIRSIAPLATPAIRPFANNRPQARPAVVVCAEAEESQTPEKIGEKTVKKVSDPMSPEFKARLREEYIGLGGSANKPMSQNYFLWISVIIGALALISYFTGSI